MAVDCCCDDFTWVSVSFLCVVANSDMTDWRWERSASYVHAEDLRVDDSAARRNWESAASIAS